MSRLRTGILVETVKRRPEFACRAGVSENFIAAIAQNHRLNLSTLDSLLNSAGYQINQPFAGKQIYNLDSRKNVTKIQANSIKQLPFTISRELEILRDIMLIHI